MTMPKLTPVILISMAAVVIVLWLFRSASLDKVNAERLAKVMRNMRDMQLFAEDYATDHGGEYATNINPEFKKLMGNSKTSELLPPFVNPVTGQRQWPILGHHKDQRAAKKARFDQIGIGLVEYTPLIGRDRTATGYMIRAGNLEDGKPILGPDGAAVLSNQ